MVDNYKYIIVTEFCEQTLEEIIRSTTLSFNQRVNYGRQLSEAL